MPRSSQKMVQIKARILSHQEVAPGSFLLKLNAPAIAGSISPGQFVHLRISDSDLPLLRRPFSLHRVRPPAIALLYQIKGEGTRILSAKRTGEILDLIGPLGNGFDLAGIPKNKKIILVAGGLGLAPLLGLADKLVTHHKKGKLAFFLGARTKDLLLGRPAIRRLGIDCFMATDDGTFGEKGLITLLFEKKLKGALKNPGMVFACGPRAMLKSMALLSRRYNFPCQISLEENMACGLGACMGCTVRFRSSSGDKKSFENKLVCKDGPVFRAREVIF